MLGSQLLETNPLIQDEVESRITDLIALGFRFVSTRCHQVTQKSILRHAHHPQVLSRNLVVLRLAFCLEFNRIENLVSINFTSPPASSD